MENNKYMTCFKHRTKTSIYPKDKIPIELFYMKNSDKLYTSYKKSMERY